MEKDNLIAKGVKHAFNGQTTVFEVDSLNEHFDGLQYHGSDIIDFEDGKYLKVGDINFSVAFSKEAKPVEEIDVTYEDLSETNLDDTPEEDPITGFDEDSLKAKLDANGIKYEQIISKESPNGIAIDLDSIPTGKTKEVIGWIENTTSNTNESEDIKITPEDPAFGTEGIVYRKSVEEADAEIKLANENIKPEDITDSNNNSAEDKKEEVFENVPEEVKKEEAIISEEITESKPKKSTKKK